MTVSPLEIHEIHKTYSGSKVLSDVSFTLKQGEVFGLIGLNGAGKTTLIKIILDLVKADSGHTSIFGVASGDIKSRAALSYLPEKFQPSRYLKGMEYLDLALSYYGKNLDITYAKQLAEKLDLNPDVLDSRVGSYSKGMGQKLGLLGALMINMPLLILDEPMSGLDPRARIKLKHLLMEAKQSGRTIFFSSHILSDIDEICDRIGIIHNGRCDFIGTPEAFKTQSQKPSLEAAFLASIESMAA